MTGRIANFDPGLIALGYTKVLEQFQFVLSGFVGLDGLGGHGVSLCFYHNSNLTLAWGVQTGCASRLKGYSTDQSEVGRLLSEYKSVFKTKRQWTSVAKKIGETIRCSARTIYRMVEQYEASPITVTGSGESMDRGDIDGPELSKQERRERDARLAIRVCLNNISNNKKREVLADLLAEEAYQVWGITEPFSVEVKPRVSAFTIDGRKKLPVHQAEEKAA